MPPRFLCFGVSNTSFATFMSITETRSVISLNDDPRLLFFAHFTEQARLPYHCPSWLQVTISALTAHSNMKLVPLFGSPLI